MNKVKHLNVPITEELQRKLREKSVTTGKSIPEVVSELLEKVLKWATTENISSTDKTKEV
jgi:hypothetical protein